ncbi:hypothetical protein BFS86_19495 [Shewanella algae]|jgi:hypothetical protein|nr:hypothetical protein BFS86_19495 [Shewanella algae]DAU40291.1 MAG TPA: hypothetical protein [Caudoviricetes sp.]
MKYIAIGKPVPNANDEWEARAQDFIPRTIVEQENAPVDTGLLNADGVKLYRMEDRAPIGFVRHPLNQG